MFSALDGLIRNWVCQLGIFKLRRGSLRWNWNPYWELAVCSLHNSVLQPDFHSVQHQCVSSRASSIKLKSVLRTCSVLNGWWKRAFYENNLFKSIQWKRGRGGWVMKNIQLIPSRANLDWWYHGSSHLGWFAARFSSWPCAEQGLWLIWSQLYWSPKRTKQSKRLK